MYSMILGPTGYPVSNRLSGFQSGRISGKIRFREVLNSTEPFDLSAHML